MTKFLAASTLLLGILIVIQGAIAFHFRINILTGTQYGPSLMPVYLIFTGISVCILGLALKTIADWGKMEKRSAGSQDAATRKPDGDTNQIER